MRSYDNAANRASSKGLIRPKWGQIFVKNKGLTDFARSESNSGGYFCIKEKEMLLTPEQKEKSSELFRNSRFAFIFEAFLGLEEGV